MKRPFFSVIIPTFNRADNLNIAIKSILRQNFNDYELIISDNASTDGTEKLCRSFNDKRIKYSKNKVNIGFNRNLYKLIKMAQGRYIFILGDDDFILNKDAFLNIYRIIKKNNYGLIRLKFVYRNDYKNLFSTYFNNIKDQELKRNEDNITLLDFLYNKAIFSFMSGLVFKNLKNISVKAIEVVKTGSIEISDFWIRFLFPPLKSNGAFIDLEDLIIASWSTHANPQFYLFKEGKIRNENIWELTSEYLTKEEKIAWVNKETNIMVVLLPSIKYYSSNKNVLLFAKRIAILNKDLYKSPFFYISLLVALLMPKFIWDLLRKIFHRTQFVSDKKILTEFEKFKKDIIYT